MQQTSLVMFSNNYCKYNCIYKIKYPMTCFILNKIPFLPEQNSTKKKCHYLLRLYNKNRIML